MKHQAINLVKFKMLSRKLRLPMWQAIGILEGVWLFAQHNARSGDLTQFGADGLAAWLEWDGDAQELVAALIETHWLDSVDGRLAVHDWDEHKPNWIRGLDARLGNAPSARPSYEPSSGPSQQPSAEPGPLPPKTLDLKPKTQPPPPAPPPASGGGDYALDLKWREVEGDLRRCGVGLASKAVAALQANGCEPDHAIDVIAFWRLHSGAWEPGALYTRLVNLRPTDDCSEFWPEPSPKAKRAAERDQSLERQNNTTEKRMAAEKQKAADIEHLKKLEQQYGGRVDGMSREELVDFIRKNFASEGEFMLGRLKGSGPPTGVVRESILAYLDSAAKRPKLISGTHR